MRIPFVAALRLLLFATFRGTDERPYMHFDLSTMN
jgi:hypothetical protein